MQENTDQNNSEYGHFSGSVELMNPAYTEKTCDWLPNRKKNVNPVKIKDRSKPLGLL